MNLLYVYLHYFLNILDCSRYNPMIFLRFFTAKFLLLFFSLFFSRIAACFMINFGCSLFESASYFPPQIWGLNYIQNYHNHHSLKIYFSDQIKLDLTLLYNINHFFQTSILVFYLQFFKIFVFHQNLITEHYFKINL